MIPTHSICYVFSHLYSIDQTTNIQPFYLITGETPTHSSSQVPRTQTTLFAALAHLHTPDRELSDLVTAGHLSQLPVRAADKPKHSSRNTHDLLSTYQLILHTKVSHIKSNHTGHQTKQVQNLVATCYHCACNLYTGFPTTQSFPPPQPLDACQLPTLLLTTQRSLFTYHS